MLAPDFCPIGSRPVPSLWFLTAGAHSPFAAQRLTAVLQQSFERLCFYGLYGLYNYVDRCWRPANETILRVCSHHRANLTHFKLSRKVSLPTCFNSGCAFKIRGKL